MLIKFFSCGIGAGSGPVNYVTREEGRENAPPDILRGDPDLTRDLIDSQNRDWRYTSGVVSFAIEDAPTPEQQEKVMNDFEKTAFAGLEQDQYNILWVRHQHTQDGRIELHFVTPRMELTTGKALNIAPPNWQKHFNPLQEALNYEHGWADPHSLERARNTHRAPENEIRVRDRESIGRFIESRVAANLAANRDDIINAIEEIGLEVHRRGKDYISVKDPENPENKPFRLKGKFYEQGWTIEQHVDRQIGREDGSGQETNRGIDCTRAERARRELAERIERRAIFHATKYNRPDRGHDAKLEASLEANNLEYSRLRVRPDYVLDYSLGGKWLEVERVNPNQAADKDRAADIKGIEQPDDRSRDLQGDQGNRLYSDLTGKGRQDAIHMRQQSLSKDTGVNDHEQQSFTAGTRIDAVRQRVGQWLSRGYQKITGWLETLNNGASAANYETRIAEQDLDRAVGRFNNAGKDLKLTLEINLEAIKPEIKRGIERIERERSRSRGLGI